MVTRLRTWILGLFRRGSTTNMWYQKLKELKYQYVYLYRQQYRDIFIGKILEVEPDFVTIQVYEEDGSELCQYVVPCMSITDVRINSLDLNRLKASVLYQLPDADKSERTANECTR